LNQRQPRALTDLGELDARRSGQRSRRIAARGEQEDQNECTAVEESLHRDAF